MGCLSSYLKGRLPDESLGCEPNALYWMEHHRMSSSAEQFPGMATGSEKCPGASRTPCLSITQSHTASCFKSFTPEFQCPEALAVNFSRSYQFFEGMTSQICYSPFRHRLGEIRYIKASGVTHQCEAFDQIDKLPSGLEFAEWRGQLNVRVHCDR